MIEKRKVLILGGSAFVGKQLIKNLSDKQVFDVHFVNRGKKYWNDQIRLCKYAKWHFGDRDQYQDFGKLLDYISRKLGITQENPWQTVIDLSSFKPKHIYSVMNGLKGKVKLYVLISSDSVYQVCDLKRLKSKGQLVTQQMSKRPQSQRYAAELADDDSYGHKKLLCQQFLQKFKGQDLKYIILRLPDVIGPYDNTGRFWAYIKWITRHQTVSSLQVSQQQKQQKLSFVYSKDVSRLLIKLIMRDEYESIKFKTFNICFEEGIQLERLIRLIAKKLGYQNFNIKSKDSNSKNFYPSVYCGQLSVQKAKASLEWRSTQLQTAVYETVRFFRKAEGEYGKEEQQADKMIRKKLKI